MKYINYSTKRVETWRCRILKIVLIIAIWIIPFDMITDIQGTLWSYKKSYMCLSGQCWCKTIKYCLSPNLHEITWFLNWADFWLLRPFWLVHVLDPVFSGLLEYCCKREGKIFEKCQYICKIRFGFWNLLQMKVV